MIFRENGKISTKNIGILINEESLNFLSLGNPWLGWQTVCVTVYVYTWHIVLKRKRGRKTVITETFHKLRGYISNVIITGVSICLHLLLQFPEYLQAWQHTMTDQSPATLKFVFFN
jgi:hypothetical protein